jgi:predicted enzyme related to lactoylglutathione lyase
MEDGTQFRRGKDAPESRSKPPYEKEETPMNIRRIVMDIQSDDFDENRNFYENLIGLELGMDLGWIMTFGSPSSPTAQLTLLKKDLTAPVNPNLTIEVEDVESIYANAIKRGLNIVHPLTNEPWGVRRFFVVDPNGLVVNVMSHLNKP